MRKVLKKIDKPLLIAMTILCAIGLVMVFSASNVSSVLQYSVPVYHFFKKQLAVMLGTYVIGFIIILGIDTSFYQKCKYLLVLGVIGALAGLYVQAVFTNGARSWYRFGFFSLQPSEFAKSIVVIYMACYFGKNLGCSKRFFFLRPIAVCAVIAGLVLFQPDLGTAIIISLTVFLTFMAVPFDKKDKDVRIFKRVGSVAVALALVVFIFGGEFLKNNELINKILTTEQTSRLVYKAPCKRPNDKTGYQVCNGMIAINNGGLFGVGLGKSTQKYLYLPEAHTDFIFPIIVEELGSIAGAFIILLYVFILFRCLKIAKYARDLTGSLIAYGTFLVILLHLLINFMGILALIPLTGVPLPLLSYGGSITLNTIALLFLTLRVSYEGKATKEEKKAKE